MKTLLLLRHAKSSWDEAHLEDHDRPLNGRGKKDAKRMGRFIRREDLVPDAVFTSTAKRARSTAKRVLGAAGYDGEVVKKRELYMAGPKAMLSAARHAPEGAQHVMLIGHNPGMEELLEALTGRTEALPTCALAQVQLSIDRWQDLAPGTSGVLTHLWLPRELDGD